MSSQPMRRQTGEEISDVPLVPCSEPHDMEVFGEITGSLKDSGI